MKLKCHTDLVMEPDALKGKTYQVVSEDSELLSIKNEQNELHHFSKWPNDEAYYGHWFEVEEE